MKNIFVVVLLIFGLIFAGCASKKVVQREQPVSPEVQKEPTVTAEESARKMPEKRQPEKITERQLAKIETKEETSKYKEEKGMFEDIYFDFDKYDIQDNSKPVVQKVSSWLLKNLSAKILVEGHCDERGTSEYNLALGDRRAKAARDYLVALGVPSSRIELISYGKEKPICTDKTEECWARNRRDHFVILREAGK